MSSSTDGQLLIGLAESDDGGAFSTLRFLDTFTEASDTALESHTPDQDDFGSAWAKLTTAGITVTGGTGTADADSNGDARYSIAGVGEDYRVVQDMVNTNGLRHNRLYVRVDDGSVGSALDVAAHWTWQRSTLPVSCNWWRLPGRTRFWRSLRWLSTTMTTGASK